MCILRIEEMVQGSEYMSSLDFTIVPNCTKDVDSPAKAITTNKQQ